MIAAVRVFVTERTQINIVYLEVHPKLSFLLFLDYNAAIMQSKRKKKIIA